jgi:hypothetical protein
MSLAPKNLNAGFTNYSPTNDYAANGFSMMRSR